jgi:BTB/POZ domain
MVTETHTFDPDGDLLLILSRSSHEDAESNTETSGKGATNTPAESVARGGSGEDAVANEDAPPGTAGQTEVVGVDNETGTPTELASEESSLSDFTSGAKKPDILVHMLVSAKHMMLASPVFKAMLEHSTFKEGRKLSSAGKVEVSLPDDDPTSFKIILDIIHGRNKQVPRQISLQLLTEISVLVNKYQMTEAVESFSEGWIDALKGGLPTKYTRDEEIWVVHYWLGISWVFGKDEEFKNMTALTERGCYAPLAEEIEESLPNFRPDFRYVSLNHLHVSCPENTFRFDLSEARRGFV